MARKQRKIEPTGKERFRVQPRLFRKPIIILQVEMGGEIDVSPFIRTDYQYRTWWKDAELVDLTEGKSDSII